MKATDLKFLVVSSLNNQGIKRQLRYCIVKRSKPGEWGGYQITDLLAPSYLLFLRPCSEPIKMGKDEP